ncbi:MAG: hypothetical protein ACD_7C00096G0010 [uncultured bacterium]|nr:MAG: hypothetical protein ACD_7C00096G0010 [uncultured bacterium]KKP68853.1 MAG: hypothetical protein UR66_C0003G0118 [Candidatus Moranbacteria bacterium GW2011_GWE1_35_17]KKP80647.1 MAG: hypothetical protein UR82_C0086G0003 [Candidatus Moranbacteria bacterium GW2011_GWF1_35_5]KKP84575.1 MAG: hypothetical protein UR83_C0018G0022 [Candidatus Moranbacteria bacterium GW2011_GWF2_35_54]HBR79269.1 hypothetical protein [Candidatus Moranbacteria bacterium]
MDFTTIITTFGLGGILGILVKHWLDNKKDLTIKLNQINEDKYRTILIHMSCSLDYENRKYFSIQKDFETSSKDYYLNCVKEYYYQSILYSPDFVLIELKKFIKNPNKENFICTARAMRRDLWGKKTKLKLEELFIETRE